MSVQARGIEVLHFHPADNFLVFEIGSLLASYFNSEFARSPLSHPQTTFSRSLRSATCNPERSHWMAMRRITNDGPERENGVWGRERAEIVQT